MPPAVLSFVGKEMGVPSESVALTVRAATAADAPALARLAGQLGYPSTPEHAARRLAVLTGDERNAVYLVEAPGGPVVAWVHVYEVHVLEMDAHAEIRGLVVEEGYRNRGAGRLLMQHAEQWARARGLGAMLLRSNVIRLRAHSFYKELGYTVIKSQKVFRKTL